MIQNILTRYAVKAGRSITFLGAYLGKRKKSASAGPRGRKTQIVVLSQFYRPEPFKYPRDVAMALADDNYDVKVVTGYPNRPGGKLYRGYRQKFRFSEIIDGIRVYRVPLIINHSHKAIERIANFVSFSVNALTLTAVVKNADAIYVYATPATAAIPAQLWSKIFGIPYVLHVQDLWPESVTDSDMVGKGTVRRLAETVMIPWLQRLYRNADGLLAISPGMRKLLVERGSDADKTHVVYNWAEEESLMTKEGSSFESDELRLLYAGNLGPMQDLKTILNTAKRFDNDAGFNLTIAGVGILGDSIQSEVEELANTRFLGLVPRDEIGKVYLGTDFQLVTLKDIPIFRTTVPSKLQASLAAGVPVITTVKGDVANLIQHYGAGLVADPENVESLSSAIEKALHMSPAERSAMGKNARRLYETQMSRGAGTSTIVSIMDTASGGAREQEQVRNENGQVSESMFVEGNL